MDIETYIQQARTLVQTEQEAIGAKHDALETFIGRVREISADPTPTSSSTGVTAVRGTQQYAAPTTQSSCRNVRTAFAETIRPHSVADINEIESLLKTIREEFTDAIAVALAPTTEASFTPELKQMVLAEARSRRSETATLQEALAREDAQFDDGAAAIDNIIAWIVDANETPLTHLGFDALKQRHETLAGHRAYCEDVARDRQEFLQKTTNNGVDASVRHRSLMPYLYQDFPVDHPVLATVATLNETCQECQRVVRDHLIRRV